jgi:hypothetical protein
MSKEKDEAAFRTAGWDNLIKGAEIFHACGDVIKIDLASDHEDIQVFLDSSEISRLLEHAFDNIPAKTDYQ